jgi:hypothetical protein
LLAYEYISNIFLGVSSRYRDLDGRPRCLFLGPEQIHAQELIKSMEHKRPLYVYIIGVAVVWAVILVLSWYRVIWRPFNTVTAVCGGFALGMLAMYIAVHLYRWK